MKKALLAASLLTVGVAAHAQSSVTLYGRLDAGLEYMSGAPTSNDAAGVTTGSANRFRAESGDWGTSLWGMKGVEDLGGGNKAVFQLEGSFNTMTGQGPGNNGSSIVGRQLVSPTTSSVPSCWVANCSSRTACGTSIRSVSRTGRRRRWCVAATGRNRATTCRGNRRRSQALTSTVSTLSRTRRASTVRHRLQPRPRRWSPGHLHHLAVPGAWPVRRNPRCSQRSAGQTRSRRLA